MVERQRKKKSGYKNEKLAGTGIVKPAPVPTQTRSCTQSEVTRTSIDTNPKLKLSTEYSTSILYSLTRFWQLPNISFNKGIHFTCALSTCTSSTYPLTKSCHERLVPRLGDVI
jgi:hypothetical protein